MAGREMLDTHSREWGGEDLSLLRRHEKRVQMAESDSVNAQRRPDVQYSQKIIKLVEEFDMVSNFSNSIGFQHMAQCLELLSNDLLEERARTSLTH